MTAAPNKKVRCAIYTRVSTEAGLDQDFNSLDAQYDAAQAYIRSQAHAGWTLIRHRYDDGGFSGGSTDRPALQQLIADIDSGVALISTQVGSTSAIGCEDLHQTTSSFLWISMRETKEAIIFCSVTFSASASPGAECRCALSADTTAVSISAAGTRAMTSGDVVIPRKHGCDT